MSIPLLNATFNEKSNGAFNNGAFSALKIWGMHPSAERLYDAAKSLTPPVTGQSAVARWLNVSPQNMTVWEKRGVSKAGAIKVQQLSGYSATWILEGIGEAKMGEAAIAPTPPGTDFDAPTREELELLDNFRHMLDHDREELSAEIAKRAERARADIARYLSRMGLHKEATM
jgi:hypothetical protein